MDIIGRSKDWTRLVAELRYSGTREGDRVLIEMPEKHVLRRVLHGREGVITRFEADWVVVQVGREYYRFRADELKVL